MSKIKIKLNTDFKVPLPGGKSLSLLKGNTIEIAVDDLGTPINNFWFRRMRDSKIDNCIEVVSSKTPAKKKESDS